MNSHLNASTIKKIGIAVAASLALSISWAPKDAKADSGQESGKRLGILTQQASENQTKNDGTAECTKTLSTCSHLQIGSKAMEILNPTIERSLDGDILIRARVIKEKSDSLHQEELIVYLTKSNPARFVTPKSHATHIPDSACKTTSGHNLIFSQISQSLLGEMPIHQANCLATP